MASLSKFCNGVIEWCFYSLFFLVPLVFVGDTYELFEFNKMWVTFGLTIIVMATWFTKMIVTRSYRVQRTPLDILLMLFLLSQLIATIFSLDSHVSFWGYYSRFNGGFLSTLCYILLYYAFVTNLTDNSTGGKKIVKRMIWVSLGTGLIVTLWGLPAHFGYDPTCLVFRGTFDVSCWTESFQPKVRIFSTLGQPDWLAAYIVFLMPLIVALGTIALKTKKGMGALVSTLAFSLLFYLFYEANFFTKARSGYIGLIIGLVVFFVGYIFVERKSFFPVTAWTRRTSHWFPVGSMIFLIGMFFFFGSPVFQLNFLTLNGITKHISQVTAPAPEPVPAQTPQAEPAEIVTDQIAYGGTESGTIRKIVWEGALDAWRHNPIFGTGVETFAFAYYQHRPAAHNMTSEWDYLYNKAHNEYLNYLATTGAVGLISYLAMIGTFLFLATRKITEQNTLGQKGGVGAFVARTFGFDMPQSKTALLELGLLAGYVSILVTNFFGFSVVIMNLYLFLVPAFVFILQETLSSYPAVGFGTNIPPTTAPQGKPKTEGTDFFQWLLLSGVWLLACYYLFTLYQFWQADRAYALGYNLNRVNQYEQAYNKLVEAVNIRGDEPVFKDELANNESLLTQSFAEKKDVANASAFARNAIQHSNEVIAQSPNNVVFWKTRVRIFYTLSQLDPRYFEQTIQAIERAHELAPTDAKIAYNLGLVYGQTGNSEKAIHALDKAIALKPDYVDAYYAEGLFYHDLAVDKDGKVIKPELQAKAVERMRYILERINPNNEGVKAALESWGE